MAVLLELLLYGAEEEVDVEGRQVAALLDVEYAEEVLESLRLVAVLQREHEVQVGLVVHLAAVRDALLEDALEEDVGERAAAVAAQLLLAQHAVVVLVQVEILAVDAQRRLGAEPVALQVLLAQLLVAQLDELVEVAAGEYLGDLHLARAQRIEEEEELAHRRAHVERVEGALEHLELGQSGYQLEYVVLQVGLLQVAEAGAVVQREADARLMQPELLGHVAQELVDRDAAARVALVQLGKYARREELYSVKLKEMQ